MSQTTNNNNNNNNNKTLLPYFALFILSFSFAYRIVCIFSSRWTLPSLPPSPSLRFLLVIFSSHTL